MHGGHYGPESRSGKMSADSFVSFLTGGVGAVAVMAVFMTLILAGRLHTDGEFNRLEAALNREKEAHDETRRALTDASARADAAVRASELIARALTNHKGLEAP
jgi:hypothetical protein